jgi:hypothetical protein
MKRVIAAVVMITLLPVAAYSAEDKGPPTVRTEKQMKEDAATEKAYLDAVKKERGGGSTAKTDPWATVRPASGSGTNH